MNLRPVVLFLTCWVVTARWVGTGGKPPVPDRRDQPCFTVGTGLGSGRLGIGTNTAKPYIPGAPPPRPLTDKQVLLPHSLHQEPDYQNQHPSAFHAATCVPAHWYLCALAPLHKHQSAIHAYGNYDSTCTRPSTPINVTKPHQMYPCVHTAGSNATNAPVQVQHWGLTCLLRSCKLANGICQNLLTTQVGASAHQAGSHWVQV